MCADASILIEILAREIFEKIKDIVEDRKYRNKLTKVYLKNGRVITGNVKTFDKSVLLFSIPEGLMIPISSILYLQVLGTERLSARPEQYNFADSNFSLRDFPHPFITEDGMFDVIFVFGEGKRDYDEYMDFMKKNKQEYPILRTGLRGDFDYLLTLASKMAFETAKRNIEMKSEKTKIVFPYGRQGIQLDTPTKESFNIISVGSGLVNSFTREILEIYGDGIPIRFRKPNDDEEIVDEVDGRCFFRREPEERDIGFIELLPNPYNPTKTVLIVAGLKVTGTQAGLLALCNAFEDRINDNFKVIDGDNIRIPARLVRAKNITYKNGLETAGNYEFV